MDRLNNIFNFVFSPTGFSGTGTGAGVKATGAGYTTVGPIRNQKPGGLT